MNNASAAVYDISNANSSALTPEQRQYLRALSERQDVAVAKWGNNLTALANGASAADLMTEAALGMGPVGAVAAVGVARGVLGAKPAGEVGASNNTNTTTDTRFLNNVTITDKNTGLVYKGTVDLQPTYDRIAKGDIGLSRNDGTEYFNRPNATTGVILLPTKPPGYYTEYVVPTPGISGAGPQRVITGKSGEMYYTPDHYDTKILVKK